MYCEQAENMGQEFIHLVWVWSAGMFWRHVRLMSVSVFPRQWEIDWQWNPLSPAWSTAARVELSSASQNLFPPRAGSDGSPAAKTESLTLASLQTAAPTGAPWTGSLSWPPLLEIRHWFICILEGCTQSQMGNWKENIYTTLLQLTSFERFAGCFAEKFVKFAELFVDCGGILCPLKQRKISGPGDSNKVETITVCPGKFMIGSVEFHLVKMPCYLKSRR